jgi:hypothetical protein
MDTSLLWKTTHLRRCFLQHPVWHIFDGLLSFNSDFHYHVRLYFPIRVLTTHKILAATPQLLVSPSNMIYRAEVPSPVFYCFMYWCLLKVTKWVTHNVWIDCSQQSRRHIQMSSLSVNKSTLPVDHCAIKTLLSVWRCLSSFWPCMLWRNIKIEWNCWSGYSFYYMQPMTSKKQLC